MKKEITSRADIEFLIDTFYKKVVIDPTIGDFFNTIIVLDWAVHIPIMYDFWETVLLGNMKYKGNPVMRHIELNRKAALTEIHFSTWVALWRETINEHFEGKKAAEAIDRAEKMEKLLLAKIKSSQNRAFIQ